MTPAHKRPWFSYSLRTMFVVVTVAAVLTLLGIELAWLRERRQVAAILKLEPSDSVRAPGISGVFGEKGYAEITLTLSPDPGTSNMTRAMAGVKMLRRLFPEAQFVTHDGEPKPWFVP